MSERLIWSGETPDEAYEVLDGAYPTCIPDRQREAPVKAKTKKQQKSAEEPTYSPFPMPISVPGKSPIFLVCDLCSSVVTSMAVHSGWHTHRTV